ncbi:carboxylating nicotinate-nucleotide diphosphorylase [Methanococcus maripaludis]|uniref:Nicotinate-nucleotide pyrophosphorylase [carboxylating] n=2 Tax=Methanococcus maripaludis TaxID=39152 RepID=A0A7J9PF67_METMI|nr:carboxylating nicotinate-nucleotide diphosphorylase [Methanococcus maripaludis]MBA2861895.1 nicotinate-nucleotide pyrophosphorylase (carboxylating) [Methanococcus maripaludis]
MLKNHALRILEESLNYDVGFGDLTTELMIPKNQESEAVFVAKEESVICGIDFVVEFMEKNGLTCTQLINDGDRVIGPFLKVRGNTKTILTLERTVLNFLMHLSGISNKTHRIIKDVREINKTVKIAATRKTHPLLSMIEKYAVFIGGGDTHRFRLDDMVMIKDNHIQAVGIKECFKRAEKLSFSKKIEIEVDTIEQLKEVIEHKPDIILLDNFEFKNIEIALDIILGFEQKTGFRPKIELSGGINENNVKDYAKYNVDVISMGSLIHSAVSVDIGLDLL